MLTGALAGIFGETGSADYRLTRAGWSMQAHIPLGDIYRDRGYAPLWLTDKGRYTARAKMLMDRLARARVDALDPAAYRLERIRAAVKKSDVVGLTAAELMIGEALLRYSADLRDMKVADASVLGLAASATSASDFERFLDGLAPSGSGYGHLREALARYEAIVVAGGWKPVPAGDTLRIGRADSRIPALRHRLAFTGDLPEGADTEQLTFDRELETAVKRFQKRHGLTPDGAVGAGTRRAMNVPAEVRLAQIETNLDMERGARARYGDRAIVVNLAAFELVAIVGGEEVLRSRTIIGQPDWQTPHIESALQWLEINPTWSVPRRIAVEEIVPRLRRQGSEYLSKRGFRLFDRRWQEMDSAEIDLASLKGDSLPFILRQDPGPANPLGNVKFMFPNDEAIFLHDTRSRGLFKRTQRALSHGCIRVDAADELARLLLKDHGWTAADYKRVVASGQPHRVRLGRPMPIHIVTRTVWAEPDGSLQFREDPYGKGQTLRLAMN